MKAVRCTEFAGYEKLSMADVPDPEPGPEEVVVRVGIGESGDTSRFQE